MTKYEKVTTEIGQEFIVRDNENGTFSWIPADPANSDYQAYLATLASELSNPSTPQAGE